MENCSEEPEPSLTNPDLETILLRLPTFYRPQLRANLTQKLLSGKPIRVYCDGVFDAMHYGHAHLFHQIKSMFPNIIVVAGICADKDVLREKGQFVLNERERVRAAEGCRWIDEVHFPAPWYPTAENLRQVRCDFTAHDAEPYVSIDSADSYQLLKQAGMFIPTVKQEGVCTSEFIARVLRNKDSFIERCIRNGVAPQELQLGIKDNLKLKLRKLLTDYSRVLFCPKKSGRRAKVVGNLNGEKKFMKNDLKHGVLVHIN